MTGVKTFLGAVGCLIFVAGCGQTTAPKEVPPVKTAAASETQAKSDPKANEKSASTSGTGLQELDGMGFQVPSSWKPLQLSDMQRGIIAAKFGIPEAGENISLTLSTSGGSLEDNLARWEGQFSGGDSMVRETISADGQDATLIRLQGRFSPGFGRPDADGWGMIGVVIPMTGQNYYVKLTGPLDELSKAEAEFMDFCKSARRS